VDGEGWLARLSPCLQGWVAAGKACHATTALGLKIARLAWLTV